MRIVAAPNGAADAQRTSLGTVNTGESYLIRIDNLLSPHRPESAQRAQDRKNAAPRITAIVQTALLAVIR